MPVVKSKANKLLKVSIMAINQRLLEILVCPVCKGTLSLDSELGELICAVDQLAYPIRDDIPVMFIGLQLIDHNLRPTARRCAKIHHAKSGLEKFKTFINVEQLVSRS